MHEACLVWQDILVDYPLDMLAIRLSIEGYLHLGTMLEIRDTMARAMTHWTPDIPLYKYGNLFYFIYVIINLVYGHVLHNNMHLLRI